MKEASKIYFFPGSEMPSLPEVGGKGLSLIQGTESGFPIPKGFVLSVNFFSSWFDKIKSSEVWENFISSPVQNWQSACNELKEFSHSLPFDDVQLQSISNALSSFSNSAMFAVRSSSPEEDLEGNSFAGGYETVLGVTVEDLEKAVKTTFASCLDYRVFVYKKENGFDIKTPKIAVVIQEQIPSEVSGVAFSLNPITNNFDEAVINSNWGLGETVVSGIVTPDTYVVNKNSRKIVSYTKGKKEKTIKLNLSGGTEEIDNFSSNEQTLNEEQISFLTDLIQRVEKSYKKPIDIEWAIYKDKIYLLQARPITAYVPMSKEMLTKPGEPKYLYQDMTISVQGLFKPMSVFSTSLYRHLAELFWKMMFYSDIKLNSKTSLIWIANGRMYANLTNILAFAGKKKFVEFSKNMDSIASKTVDNIDLEKYYKPNINTILYKLRAFWIVTRVSPYILRSIFFPAYTLKLNNRKLENFKLKALNKLNSGLPIQNLVNELLNETAKIIIKYSASMALFARFMLKKTTKNLQNSININAQDLFYLSEALPNNITTEMGLDLYNLSKHIPEDYTFEQLLENYKKDKMPEKLKTAISGYFYKYGHRCAAELDIATPRYRDLPEEFLKLVYSVRNSDTVFNPIDNFNNLCKERKSSYETIYNSVKAKSTVKAKMFKFKYRFIETFAGTREAHKYYLIFAVDIIRQRLLLEGEKFVKAGRLDSKDQIFGLTIDNIVKGLESGNFDLKSQISENTAFMRKLEKVTKLPTIFDSRGLILRQPLSAMSSEGLIVGMAISPGVARGKVKILNSPTEKPFEKGEILVAKATDPAWTPLFVNASAVILEVGGLLQHGALVAREYGLPCVAGIENATSIFKDGDLIEIDGALGAVRKINYD
jgi:rifampicin phosphotransferase